MVAKHKVVLNGASTATIPEVYGVVGMFYSSYATGGANSYTVTILDEEGADILLAGTSAIAATESEVIGPQGVAFGDLTVTLTGTGDPDEDYTCVLYIQPDA